MTNIHGSSETVIMNHDDIISTYIKKLSHPLKEIRERSLQLLLNKLQFGWHLCDDLTKCCELIQAIVIWFDQQKTMHREALQVLLIIIKSKSGSFAVKQYDSRKLIEDLKKYRPIIDDNAQNIFEDVIETLQFMHTVDSEENITVPGIELNSVSSSECEINVLQCSKCNVQHSSEESYNERGHNNNQYEIFRSNGLNVYLFPWVLLSPSDLKTIVLIEDSLKLVKSTRRSCRFIRDVFLHDFPAEIFLNRPSIVNTLLTIADGQCGNSPGEALNVLQHITVALHKRLLQLFSADLICGNNQVEYENKEYCDKVNMELQNALGGSHSPLEDTLVALRQLPAPIYALNTCNTVLSILLKSVMKFDADSVHIETLKMKEFNTCLSLVEALIEFLLECVTESFWSADHSAKSQRDIAHKSCMLMRLLGDLLLAFEESYNSEPSRAHHRLAWIRLMLCAEKIMNWSKNSPLPPTSFLNSLQHAVLDPGIDIFFPELNKRLAAVLQNAKSLVDQEFKSKYRELQKLHTSMTCAVQFMRKQTKQNASDLLLSIRNSLPILQIHGNETFLKDMASVIVTKSKDLNFDEDNWSTARSIALVLMCHNIEWVRVEFYKILSDMVKSVLMGDDTQPDQEKCLTLICDVSILTEICCHGLSSCVKEIEESASDIIVYVLRGRLVVKLYVSHWSWI
ncbi:rotatin-like isoform X2 [Leptidea sinapis]|uniref:rotatin-like isoform X2 n=1 Tax=Leptidea sinapis TaxID=189913 RepID=UPI0021C3AE5F|nr:rotatin-like isoform X2 [Leptidea sinapis]